MPTILLRQKPRQLLSATSKPAHIRALHHTNPPCFGKCLANCFACRQPCRLAHASLLMNKNAISPEALNRFRAAASQYTHTAKSRASRLLTLKDDIAALRKRGISYRAIGELLTQNGIPASDTCVTNFLPSRSERKARSQVIRQGACFASCQPSCFAKNHAGLLRPKPSCRPRRPQPANQQPCQPKLRRSRRAGRASPKLKCFHPEKTI